MRKREKEIQKARVPASANTSEPMQDVDEEQLADGSIKQNLEKRGAMSVVLYQSVCQGLRSKGDE